MHAEPNSMHLAGVHRRVRPPALAVKSGASPLRRRLFEQAFEEYVGLFDTVVESRDSHRPVQDPCGYPDRNRSSQRRNLCPNACDRNPPAIIPSLVRRQ